MKRYYGTIEYLPGQRAAIVALTDDRGNWAGAERVELPRRGYVLIDGKRYHGRQALHEIGYDAASRKALFKDGRLETFKVLK